MNSARELRTDPHTVKCEIIGDDVGGTAVHIGHRARVAALAAAQGRAFALAAAVSRH